MTPRVLEIKENIKSLKKRIRIEKDADIRDRLRMLLLVSKGFSNFEIGNRLGYSIAWVKKWIARYKVEGLDGLANRVHSGAPMKLNENQIIDLYCSILKGPDPDEILARYRIADIRDLAIRQFGVEYSISGIYYLMKKMKLSHMTPRPVHPKNDPQLMHEWKKKPKNSW